MLLELGKECLSPGEIRIAQVGNRPERVGGRSRFLVWAQPEGFCVLPKHGNEFLHIEGAGNYAPALPARDGEAIGSHEFGQVTLGPSPLLAGRAQVFVGDAGRFGFHGWCASLASTVVTDQRASRVSGGVIPESRSVVKIFPRLKDSSKTETRSAQHTRISGEVIQERNAPAGTGRCTEQGHRSGAATVALAQLESQRVLHRWRRKGSDNLAQGRVLACQSLEYSKAEKGGNRQSNQIQWQ